MSRSLAKVLSVVFHPLLMPTHLFAFILYYLPPPMFPLPLQVRWAVLALVFFTTFIIPALGTYAMIRAGQVDSFEMERREQRSLPLLFTGLCYATTAYLLYREPALDQLFYFIMGVIAVSVFLTYLISLFWKVSAHSVGVGGVLGILFLLNRLMPDGLLLLPLSLAILLAGGVLSARLALHAHTPAQVYAGFGSGFLLALVAGAIAF